MIIVTMCPWAFSLGVNIMQLGWLHWTICYMFQMSNLSRITRPVKSVAFVASFMEAGTVCWHTSGLLNEIPTWLRRQPGILLPPNEKMLIAIIRKTLVAITVCTHVWLYFLLCFLMCLLSVLLLNVTTFAYFLCSNHSTSLQLWLYFSEYLLFVASHSGENILYTIYICTYTLY